MLRKVLLILNLLPMIWIGYVTSQDGIKDFEGGLLLVSIYAWLLANIYYIYTHSSGQANKTWLGLYFERKSIEEKNKIQELKSKGL